MAYLLISFICLLALIIGVASLVSNEQKSVRSIDEKMFLTFFIIPAVPAVIFSTFCFPVGGILASGVCFVGAYVVAFWHVLILGVPAFLLGKRLNAIRWWTCIIIAFLIGGLPIGIWDDWGNFLPSGLFGASGGFAFWSLWKFWIHSDQEVKT